MKKWERKENERETKRKGEKKQVGERKREKKDWERGRKGEKRLRQKVREKRRLREKRGAFLLSYISNIFLNLSSSLLHCFFFSRFPIFTFLFPARHIYISPSPPYYALTLRPLLSLSLSLLVPFSFLVSSVVTSFISFLLQHLSF